MVTFTSRSQSFPYLYRGIVKSNIDPLNIGRCKIHIPDIYGVDDYSVTLLPWARPITQMPYTDSRGSFVLPDVGDVVWVFLEGGNKSAPVYFGGTIGTRDIPVDVDEVVLYKENDSVLIYNRILEKFTLRVKEVSIDLSEDKIDIRGRVDITGQLYVNGELINMSRLRYEILEVI